VEKEVGHLFSAKNGRFMEGIFMFKVDEYTTIAIQEGRGRYAGTYSLVEGWVGRDGEFKPNFCERQFGKNTSPVVVPVNVKLGSVKQAIEALDILLVELREIKKLQDDKDDIPF
jgi:hypothetical protein